MLRQFNCKSVCVGICISTFLILAGYHYLNDTVSCPMRKTTKVINKLRSHKYPKLTQTLVDTLLEMTRMSVKIEMWNYNYSHSDVDKLEDLVMESGGDPIRSIIVSTWRSGSSFLGDLINAVPGSFYSYEPLIMYGLNKQIRGPPFSDRGVSFLKSILKCDYSNNNTDFLKYYKFAQQYSEKFKLFQLNERYWDKCSYKEELCFNPEFTAKICKIFPFLVVKLDRFRLSAIENLLKDKEINFKLVLLVRDPRAVMQSRWNIENFCSVPEDLSDCAETSSMCADMVLDYKVAAKYLYQYPDRFMILRYEDMALNLEDMAVKLLNFLRLEPTESFFKFLKTHTTLSESEPFSTVRDTKTIPFKWKETLKFDKVNEVQEKCKDAMSLWGYERAHNASHVKSDEFNPVTSYYIK